MSGDRSPEGPLSPDEVLTQRALPIASPETISSHAAILLPPCRRAVGDNRLVLAESCGSHRVRRDSLDNEVVAH